MSTTYAGIDAFPTLITLPSDGDLRNASSINAALEGLANRTIANQADIVADAADLADLLTNGFPTGWPKLKVGNPARLQADWMPFPFSDIVLPAVDSSWTQGHVDDGTMGTLVALGAPSYVYIPIRRIHPGARLLYVEIHLIVGQSHASVPTNYPNAEILRRSGTATGATSLGAPCAWVPESPPPDALTQWNSTLGGTGIRFQQFNFTPSAPDGEVMSADEAYWLKLRDEHGGGALGGNMYLGARLYWDISEVRP